MGPYKSTILAKYIAAYLNEKRVDINMTKVQKLTYIVYGAYLAIKGERLIDEHPQAWPYGPVFPTTRSKLSKIDLNTIRLDDEDLIDISSNNDVTSLMDVVYNTFGDWSASFLSEWSHKEGSPWEKAVSTPGFKWGGRIDDNHIESYFKKIIIPNNNGEKE
jgi:uncharacterized phage-associated protein